MPWVWPNRPRNPPRRSVIIGAPSAAGLPHDCPPHRAPRAVTHPADDAAQHALSVHRLPHRLPALPRRGRPPGRPGPPVGAGALLAGRARRPARQAARHPAQETLGHAGPVRRRIRPLPGHHRAGAGLPAGPRPDPRPPHRQPHAAARGAALRVAGRVLRPRGRRPAGLGLRRAGGAGQGPPPGHALPQRPRRRAARGRRPALRVRALRRIPGDGPAHLRAPGPRPRRPANAGGRHPAPPRAGIPGPPPAPGGAAVGAVSGLGVCRLPHRPDHQGGQPGNRHGARRRLREHRAARAHRAARVRPLRLHHPRRRRAPAAGAARTPGRPARQVAAGAHLPARG